MHIAEARTVPRLMYMYRVQLSLSSIIVSQIEYVAELRLAAKKS